MAVAIIIWYDIRLGTIVNTQMQTKGLVRPVADYYRKDGHSVVRYTIRDIDDICKFHAAKVDENRTLVTDGNELLIEDAKWSIETQERIEEVEVSE